MAGAALVVSGCSGGSGVRPGVPDGGGARGEASATGSSTRAADPDEITSDDFAAVQDLLDVRAQALRRGNRKAFLATLDPGNARLRRSQEVFFDNLQDLPVDKLYYGLTESGLRPGEVRGDDPVLRPEVFEHVELSGVDELPVSNQVSITFVERGGRWLVGAENLDETFEAQSRPWYGARIEVAGDPDLLVLTDRDAAVGADALLDSTRSALADAADVLDEPDDRPLLVDATTNGLATQLSNSSGEDAGAVSFSVFATDPTGQEVTGLAGAVIKANPDFVQQLVEDSRTLRHELTHFLLDGYGGTNPQWVTEGIAEYVGYYPGLLSSSTLTDDRLLRQIRQREVELTPAGLWGNDPSLDYLTAEAFAEHLIQTYGLDKYREMMDVFKRRGRTSAIRYGEGIVEKVLRQVYGVSSDSVARGGFGLLEGLAD